MPIWGLPRGGPLQICFTRVLSLGPVFPTSFAIPVTNTTQYTALAEMRRSQDERALRIV